ncbi:MAG: FAD-dependent oxidoreductase [Rhodospirillales bacterium]|nr:FAD-dependent oxidoreductase [Rhodospirillales bacterium]
MARKDLATDVLIVGGGLVGAALGIALGQAGVDTIVVDRDDIRVRLDGRSEGRGFAIAYGSRRMLETLGVWRAVARGAEPILEIRVSERASPFFLHYDHRDIGDEPLGHMVEAGTMRTALLTRLAALASVRTIAPARVERLEPGSDGVTARLVDGRAITANLAVAADGRTSRLRGQAGIRLTRRAYGQTAIVCTVGHELPHDGIAHEHFLPAGPFAILPLRGNRASIVWTERADVAPVMMALSDDDFMDELAWRFGDFLGGLELLGRRFAHPLFVQYADRMIAERLALVGDAAHAIHPIAGQGLNMGFRDAAALAELIVAAKWARRDIGGADVLASYQRARRFDDAMMMAATDGLNRLFSNDIGPLKLARGLGLAAVNRIWPLKRLFMRQAMAAGVDLPRLIRGESLHG